VAFAPIIAPKGVVILFGLLAGKDTEVRGLNFLCRSARVWLFDSFVKFPVRERAARQLFPPSFDRRKMRLSFRRGPKLSAQDAEGQLQVA
jgi:hypothetical protein